MNRTLTLCTVLWALLPGIASAKDNINIVADNGRILRTVDCADGHVLSGVYCLDGNTDGFVEEGSREFSFLADGGLYSGESKWKKIRCSTTSCADSSITAVSMLSADGKLGVVLTYTTYPDLPLVRKEISISEFMRELG